MIKSVLKWLLVLSFVWILFQLLGPTISWDGSVCRLVKLSVYDQLNGKPIQGVNVVLHNSIETTNEQLAGSEQLSELKDRLAMNKMTGDTDTHGWVGLRAYCDAGGGAGWESLFGYHSGRFHVAQVVEINHYGYKPLLISLASLLGERHFPLSKKELEAKVWLIPIAADAAIPTTK